jgi:O-6-methylguanine DNA methyltransferase
LAKLAEPPRAEGALLLRALGPDEGEVWVGRWGARLRLHGGAVAELRLLDGAPLELPEARPEGRLAEALRQVGEYLQGRRESFSLELAVAGPPFYRLVWEALRGLPYGRTLSYAQLAALAGRPGATRAVGSAMRQNKLPLLIPCHRVTAANGKLGGFSAGTAWKRHLLELESAGRPLSFLS